MKISAVIICTNEEKNIDDCLKSVSWADEIVVIDGGSIDNTRELALKHTDKVYENKWEGYAKQRTFSLGKVNNEWMFSLDADERCTEELTKEMLERLNVEGEKYSGYEMPRRSFFLGKWVKHCGWYPDYKLRLFRKDKVKLSDNLVHERYLIDGETGRLKNDILHYTVTSISEFMDKVNVYSTLSAQEKAGKKSAGFFVLMIRPFFGFYREYIFRGGFLDGVHGLMVSFFNMITSMLTYMKIWEIQNKDKR
ncbi:MAG: glycosyltransferase family 2 protein [Ignavibacteriae bacterium]|nr:glycosyltransferase family 2 protein [Ignavibacteriota bacterium]